MTERIAFLGIGLLDLEKRNAPARVGSGPDTLPE